MGELNKKKKHNHTLTDLLKVSIFSAVMLAPFIAIGVRCGYVMWNKNAKDSYSGQNLDTYETLTSLDDVELNKKYHFTSIPTYTNSSNVTSGNVVISNITNIQTTDSDFRQKLPLTSYFIYYARLDQRQLYLYDYENNLLMSRSVFNQSLTFDFTLEAFNDVYFGATLKSFGILKQENNSYLDNAFSYSVSQISNDPVFNWTRNTGIYQPINAMVQGLDIENDTLQILLAYWSLMTAVYIVFDLIIFCFTKLTHFVND